MCASVRALSLLSAPLNCLILRSLATGPKRQVELRRETGFPAQTTLRGQLKRLETAEAITRRVRDPLSAGFEWELTEPGIELLELADALERWLARAPIGSVELDSEGAKSIIRALIGNWTSTLLHALADGAHSLTELDTMIDTLSYPSLDRRLAEMRLAAQVETLPAGPRGTPYVPTDWMRQAVAPLIVAARWGQRNPSAERRPIVPRDVEAVLLLATPLLRLAPELSGSCGVAVRLSGRGKNREVGVMLGLRAGELESCAPASLEGCNASASGAPAAWFAAVIDGDLGGLELAGDRRLAATVLDGLKTALVPNKTE